MTALEKHLISLQQKLEHLNAEVATLIALTAAETTIDKPADVNTKPSVSVASAYSKKSSIGINRYQQLQINE